MQMGGGGSAGKIVATVLLQFVIPIYLICITFSEKVSETCGRFWRKVVGVCGQNSPYHVAAFMNPVYLICTMTLL